MNPPMEADNCGDGTGRAKIIAGRAVESRETTLIEAMSDNWIRTERI